VSKPAYLVVDARAKVPGQMDRYRQLAQVAVEKFGGRYLVRGARCDVLEGEWCPERLVIVEFPDNEQAREFYDSPEYMAAREARAGVSDFQMLLVDGY
jgi:uncharacterized protein (DUF1330 family)